MSTSSSLRAEELLREAVARGASALHFKAGRDDATIFFRVDGRIEDEGLFPDFAGLIREFETLGGNKIHEDEWEWESRFFLLVEGGHVWFMASWFLDKGKNALIVSIFDPAKRLGFEQLGLSERNRAILDELISLQGGVIVGCGATGSGHATTLYAVLERLAQKGKRVASIADWPDPHLIGVTQLETSFTDFGGQVAALAGQFDVVALGNLRTQARVQIAFDLAASGHLVLGLVYVASVAAALHRFLDLDIPPDELKAYFIGGWSQTLVRHSNGKGRIALFNWMSREEARHQKLERESLSQCALGAEQMRALRSDAEPKIARGDLRREDVEQRLNP